MKSLIHVKQRARELRSVILGKDIDLFAGLQTYIKDVHQLSVKSVSKEIIGNASGLLSVDEEKVFYDELLDTDPTQRLLTVAHEAGHLELHDRLKDKVGTIDPLSPYLNTGGPALARYNRRSREEIEADAFANEFICPSREVFEEWLLDPNMTAVELSKKNGLPESLIMSRLAEGLFEEALVVPTPAPKREELRSEDPSQVVAARHVGTPALVNAGPGTGKTATLIMRIDHLLKERAAVPSNILVLTFSNEAAEELRARVERDFNAEVARQIEITTFHGFGHAKLLDWNSGLKEDFIILEESRQEELIFELLGGIDCDPILKLKDPEETSQNCVRQIVKLKERRVSPAELEASIARWRVDDPGAQEQQEKSQKLLEVYRAYETAKSDLNAVDFADLINLPLDILENNADLAAALRNQHKWVMVDEYQDVSRSVAGLLGKICGPENPPWVVGDLRQAIYLFCGASPENVTNFPVDFADARVFDLETNYRSCDEVIDVANQLAELMELPDSGVREYKVRWTRGLSMGRLDDGNPTIRAAAAESDAAEYDGIAKQVAEWLGKVNPEEIAVLARRNRDVRDIAIELGKRGLKVATPGLITPDGAAGMLACLVTHLDGRRASLPRIVHALNNGRYENSTTNRTIEILAAGAEAADRSTESPEVQQLCSEVDRLEGQLSSLEYRGDAFDLICKFLFDGSDFLRRLLGDDNEARRAINLSEVISVLSWAVAYRYCHMGIDARSSRLGFGQYLRRNLTSAKPSLAPPRSTVGAVQVMTCHASKGLEFPCVALAGQTYADFPTENWIPPDLEPPNTDAMQADALFFVGVTRAQRALSISYTETRRRHIAPLLKRWLGVHGIEVAQWRAPGGENKDVVMGPVWGYRPPTRGLAAARLKKKSCGLQVYVQDIYGGRFPMLNVALYPRFFDSARSSIRQIIAISLQTGCVSSDEATAIFVSQFNDAVVERLPFYESYLRRGIRYATGFARCFTSAPQAAEIIDTEIVFAGSSGSGLVPLRFDATGHYIDIEGNSHMILFRPEASGKLKGIELPDELNWSTIPDSDQMTLTMIRSSDQAITPWIYFGEAGKLCRVKWHRTLKSMDEAAAIGAERWKAFSGIAFDAAISDYTCEKFCASRPNCPHWMNAVPQE